MLQALRTRMNLVLLVAVALALTMLILIVTVGTKAVGVTAKGDAEQGRIDAVKSVVSDEITALFSPDYRHLDTWAASVTRSVSGDFIDFVNSQIETSKARIYAAKIIATGGVDAVAINDLKATTAKAFVMAHENETSPSLKKVAATSNCPAQTLCSPYVLEVDVVLTPGGWKISKWGPVA
ncbi:hypothetical protein Back2_26970 [Nocardioides baekrokdamisoli]|uniref:Mce-associated membrane protein n=1 Tax=Nocardioides baekrokdamisoli TaxID=1804624 RepID=A0A3G9IH79_9ACTN|nr:hypothetical protein [Nocardioides baekrokdamisoli]BBH18410.1 hypothetical protein Back2_26970 [Nocardioides baekrokdamisoli]